MRSESRSLAPRSAIGFVLLLLTLGSAIVGTLPARAETRAESATAPLTVLLTTLAPVVPEPGSVLTLSGQVHNNTKQTLDGVSISLRISRQRIESRENIARYAAGSSDPGTRGVLNGSTSLATPLAPQQSGAWTLRVPVKDLQLGSSGVYLLRLDATWPSDSAIAGTSQSFLPWFPPRRNTKPTQIVWLWPISDWPNRDAQRDLLNARTPEELSTDGRLTRLLNLGLAATHQPQWVLDPAAIQTISGMTNEYNVVSVTGEPVRGPTDGATAWLTRAKLGFKTATLFSMGYANPDLTALTRSGLNEDVVLSATIANKLATSILATPVTEQIGWPAGTRTDRATMQALRTAGVAMTVLDAAAYPPLRLADQTATGSALLPLNTAPMSVLLSDRTLSTSLGSPTSSEADAIAARQRFIAEVGVLTSNTQGDARTLVVAPDPRWNPNDAVVTSLLGALRTSPWMRSATVKDLFAPTPAAIERYLAPTSAAKQRAELRQLHLKQVGREERKLKGFSAILVEPTAISENFRSALLRTESSAWRTDRQEGSALLDRISSQLNATINQVRVVSSGSITFPSNSGKVPITIGNDLDTPVRVGVRLRAEPEFRLQASALPAITIPANRKIQLDVDATVVGTGELPVAIQLTTPAGKPYGMPTIVTLRSSAYAKAATWVVAIAFIVLTTLLVMNSLRRRRTLATQTTSSTQTPPPDPDTSDV